MKTIKMASAAVIMLFALSANAQKFDDSASFPFGSFDVTPVVDLALRYDDNVIRSDINAIESWSRIIAPQITMSSSLGASDVTFGYRIVNEDFFSTSADDATDHFLFAQSNVEFDSRNRLIASLNFEDGHDRRGSNFSIGLGEQLTETDKFKESDFDLLYSYGAFNASGRLDLNFNITELNYDRDIPVYRARDRVSTTVGGTFFYRISPATDATFDVIYTNISYKFDLEQGNPLDSRELSYLVGLDWEATSKTSGFAKIGYEQKNFTSSQRTDFSGIDWTLGVLWEPVAYSSVEITTSADSNETNGEGDFIRGENYSIEWRHEWLERFRTSVRFSLANDVYEGQIADDLAIREDDYQRFQATAYYQFRRWLNFELAYIYDERDSNRNRINYGRNQLFLNALITL
ncbi:outer membrane beta-barrel protein [Glaciecola sp. XM2]|jgi:hypothetical protein|uniref:outer membrane beta-barrel protein n=1 Tax=Glaciecola sp. XM2 TaxID=1914931 RepID=UPI001BDED4F6|nr:outer membrane beta-barrel protein [Glaciecola sp. XM2]MBT1452458.1 outer membrane beta-barrel protein [Glaciecola sp. XM2]